MYVYKYIKIRKNIDICERKSMGFFPSYLTKLQLYGASDTIFIWQYCCN